MKMKTLSLPQMRFWQRVQPGILCTFASGAVRLVGEGGSAHTPKTDRKTLSGARV